MTILGVVMTDSPSGSARHSSRNDPRPWPFRAHPPSMLVTIRFDHGVPALCRHHPAVTPVEPIPSTRGAHRHRRQASPRPGLVQRWSMTLRVTVVLTVLLGGAAAIAFGALGHDRHTPAEPGLTTPTADTASLPMSRAAQPSA